MRDLYANYRFRAGVEIVSLSLTIAYMAANGAPIWALTLAFYIGSRASIMTNASDNEALQRSIHVADGNVDRVHALITSIATQGAHDGRAEERED